eukprot:Filipodium_phascolosomae@DN1360_c0_g1_i1.p1
MDAEPSAYHIDTAHRLFHEVPRDAANETGAATDYWSQQPNTSATVPVCAHDDGHNGSSLTLHCAGQILGCYLPGEGGPLVCRFHFVYGPGWKVLTGRSEGVSQIAQGSLFGGFEGVVWSCPFDCVFKSDAVQGWPRFALEVDGFDWQNRQIIKGYSSVHVPTCSRGQDRKLLLYKPVSSSKLLQLKALWSGLHPQFVSEHAWAQPEGREVVQVASHGEAQVGGALMGHSGTSQVHFDCFVDNRGPFQLE